MICVCVVLLYFVSFLQPVQFHSLSCIKFNISITLRSDEFVILDKHQRHFGVKTRAHTELIDRKRMTQHTNLLTLTLIFPSLTHATKHKLQIIIRISLIVLFCVFLLLLFHSDVYIHFNTRISQQQQRTKNEGIRKTAL